MAKKEETTFGEKVDAELKAVFGTNIRIFNIQQRTKRGDPDRLICLHGIFIAIELKTDVGTLDKLQWLKLREVERAQGLAYVATPSTWPSILDDLIEDFGKD